MREILQYSFSLTSYFVNMFYFLCDFLISADQRYYKTQEVNILTVILDDKEFIYSEIYPTCLTVLFSRTRMRQKEGRGCCKNGETIFTTPPLSVCVRTYLQKCRETRNLFIGKIYFVRNRSDIEIRPSMIQITKLTLLTKIRYSLPRILSYLKRDA